jgi:hypothetical protein
MIEDRKMMITIVWNPQDFHLIDKLPKDRKFNASYDFDMILQSLLENRPTGPGLGLIIHADHALPHAARKTLTFCRENCRGMAPNPAYSTYSPDLAPSNFCCLNMLSMR